MRRIDFIKRVGMLGAGAILAHDALANTLVTGAGAPPIGVGVIGCGDRGKGIMHLINNSPDSRFKTVAYADVLPFRLQEAKPYADAKAKSCTDYRQLLDSKEVAAVIIAVPLYLHYQVAKDAILAGKHVYLEKTMTFTIAEALDLAKLVRSRPKQVFQVGYQYRYSPLYFKVKEMIQTGYLGKVTQIDCRWDRNNNWRRSVPDPKLERQINWRMYREYSGGVVAELLSHQMDFIHWAFETHPDEIVAYGGIDIYKDGRETFDNVQLMLRYKEQGIVGNFGTTLGNARDGYLFRIKGTKGTVSLLPSTGVFYPERAAVQANDIVDGVTGATKLVPNKDGGIPILAEPTRDGTHYALADFYKAITENTTPSSDIHTGTKGTICASLANESLYAGNIMYWKDEYNLI